MPKAKKIAPSPSSTSTPYQAFPPPLPRLPSAGGSGDSSSSRGHQRPRVYTPRACQNCQTRKTKCSGQPGPCNRCAAEKIECIFDTTTDQRRREASTKKEEEARKTKECLDQLLELLGSTDEQKLGRVREMVREGATWEGILEFLDRMKSHSMRSTSSVPTVTESTSQAPEQSAPTLTAFDEWIAEVFGSPEPPDDPTGMEQ